MKQLVFLFGFLFGACSAQELDLEKSADYSLWKHPISIPLGGNTFTSDQDHQNKVSQQGITSWRDSKNVWDVFLYVAQPGNFLVSLDGNASEPSVLSVSINGQNKLVKFPPRYLAIKKSGYLILKLGITKSLFKGFLDRLIIQI